MNWRQTHVIIGFMRSHPLEPGLLGIFRIYVFLRIGAMILIATVFLGGFGVPFEVEFIPTAALFAIEIILLVVALFLTTKLDITSSKAQQEEVSIPA